MDDKKFAILIDGDNSTKKYIKTIMDEVAKVGTATYKRAYADWTDPRNSSWKEALLGYSITPMQQYAYTKGKNATDSAMIIDAMDILYKDNVDGFCLVSSDSDFTRLAARLREAGMEVIGMGEQKTPQPFVRSCSMFKYLDLISEGKAAEQTAVSAADNADNKESIKTPLKSIKKSIDKLIDENSDDDGWVLASSVGTYLQNKYNDFDSRNYGKKKTIELLKDLGYDTKVSSDKSTYFISKPRKNAKASADKPKQTAKKKK